MSADLSGLEPEVSSIALCWRLARRDGVVLGFTNHDRDIRMAGVTYRASPGLTPSAVVQTDGLEGDSMSIEGVLSAASITSVDLEVGRWSGSAVDVFACDWVDPDGGFLCLSRGRVGDVARPIVGSNGAFRVELLTDMDLSAALLPLRLSPTCRHQLGDAICGVSLDGLRIDSQVVGGADDRLLIEPSVENPGRFAMGALRFVRGPLSGIDRVIVSIAGGEIFLDEEVPSEMLAGSWVRLTPGCDKRYSTCTDRFGNAPMFGGEPHVPGTDALLRYATG